MRAGEGARTAHCGSAPSKIFDATGVRSESFSRESLVTVGCRDTAFDTTVRTSGTSPASADIVKLVDPWQCTSALMLSAPVRCPDLRTAAGWSNTAAWSSVYRSGGRSIDARQSSTHTS